MRTALICHRERALDTEVTIGLLASVGEVLGVVLIEEPRRRMLDRLRWEWRRSGLRILDVLTFRLWYRVSRAARDQKWLTSRLTELRQRYPPPADSPPSFVTADPNSPEARAFLASLEPDLVLAQCKTLLRRETFGIPKNGTFVVHPGICPEYRNAHGCFWALARRDLDHVGATLLRIDEGIDTGPIYGYYRAAIDERTESHVVIQNRVVLDNLQPIAEDLARVNAGDAKPIDVGGRSSATWGQPRLTDYLRWKRAARAASR